MAILKISSRWSSLRSERGANLLRNLDPVRRLAAGFTLFETTIFTRLTTRPLFARAVQFGSSPNCPSQPDRRLETDRRAGTQVRRRLLLILLATAVSKGIRKCFVRRWLLDRVEGKPAARTTETEQLLWSFERHHIRCPINVGNAVSFP